MIKKTFLISSVIFSLLICSCSYLGFIAERLNVFLVNFSFNGIGISLVTPPNLISLHLSDYGIAVNCRVSAKNDNTSRAVFDGANFMLRVNDTAKRAGGVTSFIPSFTVEPSSQASFTIPFKIMLDNPLFSKAVFQKVAVGESIPYRISADLFFKLIAPSLDGSGNQTSLGTKTMTVDLVKDAVDTRPDLGSFAGKAFTAALNLISGR